MARVCSSDVAGIDEDSRMSRLHARTFVAVGFLVCFAPSCRARRRADAIRVADRKPVPVTLFGGLDGSASYTADLERARRQLNAVVRQLPPGSDANIRWITSDSYSGRNTISTTVLPDLEAAGSNPFDVRSRERERQAKQAYTSSMAALAAEIDGAPSPKAAATDILGFLVVGAERASNAGNRPVVIALASDLMNNRETYRRHLNPTSLRGCRIIVLACTAPTPARRAMAELEFRSWGVTSVTFLSIDEAVPPGVLTGARDTR
jgi:hypothetical protein